MKLINKLKEMLFDASKSLTERVYVMLTIIALAIVSLALLGDILYDENIIEIITHIITLVAVPAFTYIGVKNKRVELTTRIVSLGVVLIVIPLSFFFGGGISGGTIPWFVFSYLYIGLVLSGAWRLTMLAVLTAVIYILYYLGYYYPEYIISQGKEIQFMDSFLAVVEVGIVCFVMTWFQNRLYMEENKRAREETKKVEELNNTKNRFFSSMSHEIRTPINSILGLNEVILRQEDASEEIKRDAGKIQGAGRMLLAIINDILDFSKIEAGKMDIVPVNYSLKALVSEIVSMIWLRAEQKGLEFKVEVDPSIPAELFGDEVRIKQILINLLSNAVKYTQEGTVTLYIEKETIQEDQVAITFSVSDTGMGIKQDSIPYLFDAFQRVDEEKNAKIEGTGLGLSIVKNLVELMGGRITVNSIYTQGSTFMVTLWQKIISPESVGEFNVENYENPATVGSYEPGFTAPDVRILIVDDNEMNLEVERKLLADAEMTIDTAMSGRQALDMTSSNAYDIIFMDHLMPEMDGIECLRNIRKQPSGLNTRTPIIALTANTGGESKELYARSGFEDYLVKPVSGNQLENMVLSYLPESKVVPLRDGSLARFSMNTKKGYNRRVSVVITVGNICDLPRREISKYQIECIPFIIRHEDKIFYDGLEVQTDELMRYLKNGQNFESDTPSVEEYEKFFAQQLKKALNVIYISSAGTVSKEYSRASQAAKAYGNVEIFDSGVGSSAIGVLALLAQRMASKGESVERILEELGKARSLLHCSFITDGDLYMRTKDAYSKVIADVMRTFSIRPIIKCQESVYKMERLEIGDLEEAYKRYIDYAIPAYRKPDLDMIIVNHPDLTERQKEYIRKLILANQKFEHIIFIKISSVMALNVGAGALGLTFYEKNAEPYRIGSMFLPDNENEVVESIAYDEDYEDTSRDDISGESLSESESEKEPVWYEGIEGLDQNIAIQNSGSLDVFKSVLKIFYDSIDEKLNDISRCYDTEDWENYTIKVHALKSSAKLVGAMKLSEDALGLENAGKEGNTEYIREHNEEVITQLKRYKEALSGICGGVDENLLESMYDALIEGIGDKDKAYISQTINEAREYGFPDEVVEKLDKIESLLGQDNFEEMKAVIAR
ncbi:MAG: DegV family EDD domain-containing protein [Butyrivibrio sp.]|nr:DegV family EDD domain-containing protein [Butyrivibrio sp.]